MSDEYIKKEDVLKFIEDIKCNPDIPKNYGTLLDIMRYIRKMPTYDVDKVAKKLEQEGDNIFSTHFPEEGWEFMANGTAEGFWRSAEIVKSGGVSDD